jgi:hypothetical protein
MKCFHCKQTFLKVISAGKKVFPKTCVNCGRPQAQRASQRPGKPGKK